MKTCRMTSRLRLCLEALTLVVAFGSGTARADDSTEVDTARQRFQEGVRYFDRGQYSKARVAFLQAYALKRHPAVLLNLAQSELRIPGHDAIAAQHFSEYLRVAPEDATRMEAEKGLEEAKLRIGTFTLQCDDVGAEVLIDGEHFGVTPLETPIFLKPGNFQLEVRKGAAVKSTTITAVAGATSTIRAQLVKPTQRTAPTSRSTGESRHSSSNDTHGREPFFKWLGHHPSVWIVAVTAFAGGGGTAAGLWLASDNNERYATELGSKLLRAVAPGTQPCSASNIAAQDPTTAAAFRANCTAYRNAVDARDRYQTFSFVAGGIGLGALILLPPIVYLFDSGHSSPRAPSRQHSDGQRYRERPHLAIVPNVSLQGGGIGIIGQF